MRAIFLFLVLGVLAVLYPGVFLAIALVALIANRTGRRLRHNQPPALVVFRPGEALERRFAQLG